MNNGKAQRKLTEAEETELNWKYVVGELTDDAKHIRETLALLDQISAPWTEDQDLALIITVWSMQYQGFELVALADPDPGVS